MTHTPPAPEAVQPPNVHNGTYTVAHPERGHFTLKLHTAQKGDLAGERILSLLVGPDNTTSYRGVAFWKDAEKRAVVWKKHRGPQSVQPIDGFTWQQRGWSAVEQKLAIWADLATRGATDELHGFWYGEGYRLHLEGRCVVCNRKLTDPESIQLGIGPTCGGRA